MQQRDPWFCVYERYFEKATQLHQESEVVHELAYAVFFGCLSREVASHDCA